jgi:hypothetical protein
MFFGRLLMLIIMIVLAWVIIRWMVRSWRQTAIKEKMEQIRGEEAGAKAITGFTRSRKRGANKKDQETIRNFTTPGRN